MRKFGLNLILLIVLLVSVSAYTGFSGVETTLEEKSLEEEISGSDWNLKFDLIESDSRELGVNNYTVEGNQTVVYGTLMLSNGCEKLDYRFNETKNGHYNLDVYSRSNSNESIGCTQEVTYQGYKASLQAEKPYKIVMSTGENSTEIVNKDDNRKQGFSLMRLIKGILP